MIRMLGLSLSLVLACGAFAEEPKKVTPKSFISTANCFMCLMMPTYENHT
mgnify:CR=1 FL=1